MMAFKLSIKHPKRCRLLCNWESGLSLVVQNWRAVYCDGVIHKSSLHDSVVAERLDHLAFGYYWRYCNYCNYSWYSIHVLGRPDASRLM